LDDVLKLPATMDVARARSVFEDLSRRRGSPLRIDASEVEKTSALAIEVLIAGERQWAADGVAFEVANLPECVLETWSDLGLDAALGAPAKRPRETDGSVA